MKSHRFEHEASVRRLQAYIVDLEVEVDRLRQHSRNLHEQMQGGLESLSSSTVDAECKSRLTTLLALLNDLQYPEEYHPSTDHVAGILLRPLVEQVFRYHQRLTGVGNASLKIQLGNERIDWFPGRFRHILDNLISNALKYRDPTKTDTRVTVDVQADDSQWYTLIISDNGLGMSKSERDRFSDLNARAKPLADDDLVGVGLTIVKRLIDQSGGAMTINSRESEGTSVSVVLPRYATDDFLV